MITGADTYEYVAVVCSNRIDKEYVLEQYLKKNSTGYKHYIIVPTMLEYIS
jgi:hypothetical protein